MQLKHLALVVVLSACPTLPGLDDGGVDGGDAGRPVPPPALDVTAGATHACSRMADGTVRCWGCYCSGGLLGTLTSDGLPVTIPGVTNATQLALGTDLSCALLSGGGVRCWGRGGAGQLGNGATEDSNAPVDVTPLGVQALEIAAGDRHVCARLSDGTVSCWGDNRVRQLGDMSMADQKSMPTTLGNIGATQIDLGKTHACARRASGTVVCWGENSAGQLGDGTLFTPGSPVPVLAPGLSGTRVSAGRRSCLLRDDRGISCWGDGASTPEETFAADGGWREVAAGGAHVCARAASGAIDCLDAGTVSVPNAVQLAAGDRFTCAVTDGGTVYCWGRNDVGQLGDGRQGTDSATPVKVGF